MANADAAKLLLAEGYSAYSSGSPFARGRRGNASGDRKEARMAESKTTTNHDEIRRWVEDRGGRPAAVRDTGGDGDAGILRIDFGDQEEGLEEISWDDFFKTFDESNLAFLFQDTTEGGAQSRFNKFVSR
jgi:hypothetical protein